MSNISELANIPEISFIENMTLQEAEEITKEAFARYYREQFGTEPELGDADPKTLMIKAFSYIAYQDLQYIDAKGRAELLKTSTGDALEALGALLGVQRQDGTKATATERFSLAEARADTVAIPAGTRVKTANGRYFNTLDYTEITPGETYVETIVQAEEAGAKSDGILEGVINLLVDPIPYIANVENTTKSAGGLDVENDESLTKRIYLAPSRFSCAGPYDAYEYYAREWRGDVDDVKITSPEPCVVAIYFTMLDTETGLPRLPTETEIESLTDYLSGETIRPLTDKVECRKPEVVDYTIDFTYWIAASDQKSAGTIQTKIATAVTEYQTWQMALGRDVNPTELIYRVRAAGAKRVKVTEPTDTVVSSIQLPRCSGAPTVNYGGLEDD